MQVFSYVTTCRLQKIQDLNERMKRKFNVDEKNINDQSCRSRTYCSVIVSPAIESQKKV